MSRTPALRDEPPLLGAESLTRRYEGKIALDAVDLDIRRAEALALVGENGAGKSTLVRVLTGVIAADSGRIRIDGEDVDIRSPADARALGIAAVHQDFDLAPNMTVAENLVLNDEPRALPGFVDRRRQRETAAERLATVRLDIDPETPVFRLSAAERQLVAIARAVASPVRLLVLDEPTSALATDDIEHLLGVIERQHSAGTAVLFISHKLDEILQICDRVYVLRDGRNAGILHAADTNASQIISLMVGRELQQSEHRTHANTGRPLLDVSGLLANGLSAPVGLSLAAGEIVGLYGLKGAGRIHLLRTLFGLQEPRSGEIRVAGRPVRFRSAQDAVSHGLAWVCRDRKALGLFDNLNLRENLSIASLGSIARWGIINLRSERRAAADAVGRFAIRTTGLDQEISTLSGGNQQKVLFARWLLCGPRILILDEPTAGIDVGARSEIYGLIDELASTGIGILLVSSDLPEALTLSDRLFVMHEGAIAGMLGREEASEERIMQLIHDRTSRGAERSVDTRVC